MENEGYKRCVEETDGHSSSEGLISPSKKKTTSLITAVFCHSKADMLIVDFTLLSA
jgi:hypothetical protein